MKNTKAVLLLFVMFGTSAAFPQPSLNPSVRSSAGVPSGPARLLPSASESLSSPIRQRSLSVEGPYRVGRQQLSCNLADSRLVRVTLVEDSLPYLFLAVQGAYGPTILANEWRVNDSSPEYAVFAFYRECAFHALGKVTSTQSQWGSYPPEVSKAADCLAVTEMAESTGKSPDWNKLESTLKAVFGSRYPVSSSGLKSCLDPGHRDALVQKVRKP